ncbi:MAG TPA: 1,4-alpha-glucan branching protein GlgB [Segeticoccus sp.]|uniref:1,4-alpha-glucan branching protein GlgB n=1 Tax=Segeticoccus sp. TaxID=2706531 RepID=UPI002D7F126D|nr:1,4-alpha-glucan branching protein GlgB [Segeticoccus sp.]HET8600847.1 1,4-alpha-glucan branching protein GlgB [Segeticoccus sp.]
MAEIHQATITPSKLDLLTDWIAGQRWYAGKGRQPRLRRLWSWRLDDPEGRVGIETVLVADDSGSEPTVYQVPLTYRDTPLEGAEHALLGTTEHSVLGRRWVYDAPHDPVYARQLLALVLGDTVAQSGQVSHTREPLVLSHPQQGAREVRVRETHVLSGEQSNTSIIYETSDAAGAHSTPLICKVFRVLHDGDNPDVVLQEALASAGSTAVPTPVGHLSASWPDAQGGSGVAHGDIATAQEFIPDVEDAWRVALRVAAAGGDFSEPARSLGRATARVHRTLREALPTVEPSEADRRSLVSSMRSRAQAALREASQLAEHRTQIDEVIDGASGAAWPELQRIHGDFHLGQVLDVPGRGWVMVDFEGEPLRPLAERTRPDLALRDVAGMLRSFDYAAGSAERGDGTSRAPWARAARHAFLLGYAEIADRDPREDEALLEALELDKALYEVVYEARNRPEWLPLPLAGVERILAERRMSSSVEPTAPAEAPATGTAGRPTAPAAAQPTGPTVHPVSREELDLLVRGLHGNPHAVLGAHEHEGVVTVRALRPWAQRVLVELGDGQSVDLQHEYGGIWAGTLPTSTVPDYRLVVSYEDGIEHRQDDPYRFLPTLGEIDLHLIGEGRHEQLWSVLGSHVRRYDGPLGPVSGTSFAVWAPHAKAIRVIGDFNHWDGATHPMRALGSTGVWELFVPDVGEGTRYKYEITGADGVRRPKSDPLARATEAPPATASVVTRSAYEWDDGDWMRHRRESDPHTGPMSIYEVHLGSWRQGHSYRDLAEDLVNYVKDLGFTHVEFLPVMEHPYGPSWGYQVTGYYAPTARFGSPDDFRHLVDTLHRNGIGVILDWVPAHFPKDAFGLARFDGQPLYEHPDPRRGDQPDWGTHIFDFGRPQVRNFLVANALYWMEEFHADGIRVDAVASMLYLDYSREPGQWLPNKYGGREHLEAVELLQETNATAYRREPGVVTVAEESTSWPGVTRPTHLGGLGFGLKWNMGWMHDSLNYLSKETIYRQYHHHQLTFSMMYAYSENFVLPISHDEVVHGKGSLLRKMPGDRWQQLANVRAFLAYMWSHPGKQLLFMGCEFGQEAEWADSRSLDWWLLDQPAHWGLHSLVRDLNTVYRSRPQLWELDSDPAGFQWIDANDSGGNTFSYLRFGSEHGSRRRPALASVVNFSAIPHGDFRLGLPYPGRWNEVVNTDAGDYGGSGVGNLGGVEAEAVPWHGQPYSAVLTLPPLGALWLEPAHESEPTDELETR